MQWLMKYCARGALGLGAAALLLSGIPARANPVPGAPEAQFRENQPRLLAQSTTQPTAAEQMEKRRLEEQQKKAAMEKQQQQTIPTEEDEDPGGDTGGGGAAPSRPGTIWRRGYPG